MKPIYINLQFFLLTISPVFTETSVLAPIRQNNYLLAIFAAGILGLIFAVFLTYRLLIRSEGTEIMIKIASAIREGSDAFLKKQYTSTTIFVVIVAGILFVMYGSGNTFYGLITTASFTSGAVISALSGIIGMKIATRSNARTTWAAKESLNLGLRVAFSSGSIMGISVVSLGILSLVVILFSCFTAAIA